MVFCPQFEANVRSRGGLTTIEIGERGTSKSSFFLYHIYFGVYIALNVHDSTELVFTCRASALYLYTPLHVSWPKLLGKLNFWQIFASWALGGGYGYRFTVAARLGYPYHFNQRQHPNLALMLIKIVWPPQSLSVPAILCLAFS